MHDRRVLTTWIQTRILPRMVKTALPPANLEPRGSINLRIEAQTRQLIDEAAAALGKTRTEFMVESARRQAIDVLLDQRLFALSPERFDAFAHLLDNPPAPGPKLRSLLRRVPAWSKQARDDQA